VCVCPHCSVPRAMLSAVAGDWLLLAHTQHAHAHPTLLPALLARLLACLLPCLPAYFPACLPACLPAGCCCTTALTACRARTAT
jgi:hypothetical protein